MESITENTAKEAVDESCIEIYKDLKQQKECTLQNVWCFALNNSDMYKHLHPDAVMKVTSTITGALSALDATDTEPPNKENFLDFLIRGVENAEF